MLQKCWTQLLLWVSLNKLLFFLFIILTKSEDGAAKRHNDLSVLEHLGLGLELDGADHEDDHAGHEECDAEVEERQAASETLISITENREWWIDKRD